jgi:hypothetical protein
MSVRISQDQRKECGSQVIVRCAKSLEFCEKVCSCKHELSGTGGVFLQSLGIILCNECKGEQVIRRPIK